MDKKAGAAPTAAPTPTDAAPTATPNGDYITVLQAAFWWLSLGVDLVPLYPRSKFIFRGFGPHQSRLIDRRGLPLWFGDPANCHNLGIVLGGLFGLMCLDFDDAKLFDDWRRGPGAGANTRIERTARGYHVFFVTTIPPTGAPVKGLEVKTSGVIMVAPSVNAEAFRYHVVTDGPITSYRPEYFPRPFLSLSSSPTGMRTRRTESALGDLLARIKQTHPIRATALNYFPDLRLTGSGRYQHGRCPFHDDRRASFWIDNDLSLWGCLASSCPQRGTHDVINLVAAVRRFSLREAILTLAGEGGY